MVNSKFGTLTKYRSGIKNAFTFFLLPIILSGLLGCGGGSDDDQKAENCTSKGLDAACFPPAGIVSLTPSSLKMVNFFIETSGSMHGFMPANATRTTDFQMFIPDLLQRSRDNITTNFYTIFDSRTKFQKENINVAVTNKIPKGNFKWSGNTYVPVMLDSVKRYLDANTVNIFISDCIYSPSSGNVKITAQTIAEIRGVIKGSTDQYTTVIYMVKSAYFPKTGPSVLSPYYLVLQGKQENILPVAKMIRQSLETFHQQAEEVRFGDKYSAPYYSVLRYTQNSSNFIASRNPKTDTYTSLEDIEDDAGKLQFWVGIDLSALPSYARNTDYLQANLAATVSKGNVSILEVAGSLNNIKPDDRKFADKCSAFVHLSVDQLTDNVALVSLSLSRNRPDWVAAVSHDTLAVKETLRTKTFGWANIITGVEQAYNFSPGSPYFNPVIISLIKK